VNQDSTNKNPPRPLSADDDLACKPPADQLSAGDLTSRKEPIASSDAWLPGATIPFDLPSPGGPPAEILATHDALAKSIASGEVTPREAESISAVHAQR
jgi:hypothetical protein